MDYNKRCQNQPMTLVSGGCLSRMKVTFLGLYNGLTGEQVSYDVVGDEELVEESCRENGLDDISFESLLEFWKANVEDPTSRIDNHLGRTKLYEKMYEERTLGMTAEEKDVWTKTSLKRNGLFKQQAWIAYGSDFFNQIGLDLVLISTQPGLLTKFWSEMDFGMRTFPDNWFMVDPQLPDQNRWLPWYKHVDTPLVWISLRVDESGIKALDSWLPEQTHETLYNEAQRLLRQNNLDPYNRPDISQTVGYLET